MTSSFPPQEPAISAVGQQFPGQSFLRSQPWLTYVLPFAVFMLAGLLEPEMPPTDQKADPPLPARAAETRIAAEAHSAAERASGSTSANGELEVPIAETEMSEDAPAPTHAPVWLSYPLAYTIRITLTLAAIVWVWPSWKLTPGGVHLLAVWIGVLGGVLWVAVCRCRWEDRLLTLIGLEQWAAWGDRQAFDPCAYFAGATAWLVVFLALRFVALTVMVPLFEEFFLRGFLMRFPLQADWWNIPLGSATWASGAIVVAYAVLSHPAEPIAAALWFTLITLLYARTRSLWDCVIAHGVTNGIMGVYILGWRDWTLW